jgi:hypothetical protein
MTEAFTQVDRSRRSKSKGRSKKLSGTETATNLRFPVAAPHPVLEGNTISKQVYLSLLKENDRLKAQVCEKKKGSEGLRQKYKDLKAGATEKYRWF